MSALSAVACMRWPSSRSVMVRPARAKPTWWRMLPRDTSPSRWTLRSTSIGSPAARRALPHRPWAGPMVRVRSRPGGRRSAGQVGEVFRPQPGRDRGDQVPVEQEVDAALVGPDRQCPASQCLVDAYTLSAGHSVSSPLGGTLTSNSTAVPWGGRTGGSMTLIADSGSHEVCSDWSSSVRPVA